MQSIIIDGVTYVPQLTHYAVGQTFQMPDSYHRGVIEALALDLNGTVGYLITRIPNTVGSMKTRPFSCGNDFAILPHHDIKIVEG